MSADNVAPVLPGFDEPMLRPASGSVIPRSLLGRPQQLYACVGCWGVRARSQLDRTFRCEECIWGQLRLLDVLDRGAELMGPSGSGS